MIKRQQTYRRILGKVRTLYEISERLMGSPEEADGFGDAGCPGNAGGFGNADSRENADGCEKLTSLYVMAPVMCMYVAWVLREARAAGTKRLYFLARDGYSMYETARVFCEKKGISIECRYLYCSRYAWRGAEYHLLGEESLSYICLGGIDVNFRKLMFRAGLTDREGKEIAALTGMAEDYEKPLTYRRLKELRTLLAACKPFMDKMTRKSRHAYPLVTGYLRQEGLLEPVPWALVDSGWTGSMQKSLQHLLDSAGYEGKAEGFYFGMYEYPRGMNPDTYHCWYFSPADGLRRKAYFSNSLFECIFSSPEGMTTGYEKRDGLYCPVLEKRWNPNREKIIAATGYLKRYAEGLSERAGEGTDPSDFPVQKQKKIASALLKNFMGRPSPEEAREFGSYVFCDDVIGEGDQKAAAELTPEQIRENWLLYKTAGYLKKNGSRVRESAWLEGSMMGAGMDAAGLWHCALSRYALYLRKRMRDLLKHING